jgi:signal transduction histidine kinase
MTVGAAQRAEDMQVSPKKRGLAQLLHALNQPLTGLQCSMEVTLASPRPSERYVQCLREGLELTERMRGLVEAIREVADVEDESREAEVIEVKNVLRETVEGLWPVAEAKGVDLVLNYAVPDSLAMRTQRGRAKRAMFRMVEAGLSLAEPGSALRVETGGASGDGWVRIRWQGGLVAGSSRPELALLVAQAGWERDGAEWERERRENVETVTIHLPACVSIEKP